MDQQPIDHHHGSDQVCAACASPVDALDRHLRYELPDAVLDLPEEERAAGMWTEGPDPRTAVMLEVPGIGSFVRCLLPVRLDDGGSLTYGVWLGVSGEALRRAFDVWWAPPYAHLQLEGSLANDVPPGGTLGSDVEAVVRNLDHTPYITASAHPVVQRLLAEVWPVSAHRG